jgi:hypothetical protein
MGAPPSDGGMGQVPAYQQNQYYAPQQGGGDRKPPIAVAAVPGQEWKPAVQTTVTPLGPPSPHPYAGAQEVMGTPVMMPVELPAQGR